MGRKSRQSRVDAREAEIATLRAEISSARVDGWANVLTGLGSSNDKRMGGMVTVRKFSYADCEALYRGSDMAARIADSVPDEMTREGWDLQCENDSETSEAVGQQWEDLDVESRYNLALKWARAFGGAGIIVGADDGVSDVSLPLRMDKIRAVEWLSVLDCRELVPWTFYLDPMSPHYGEPSSYKIMPYNVGIGPGGVAYEERKQPLYAAQWKEIHATRVLRFEGVVVNRYQMRETWGWGSSIYERVYEVLRDFSSSYDSAASLVQDFSQGVFWIHNLAGLLASANGEDLQKRMALINLQRSVLGAAILDAGEDVTGAGKEDFERKATPMSGLPEILDRLAHRLAAAVDMPVTRLMGQQPAGLNATGDNDIRRWYDHVANLQRMKLKPQLKRLTQILFAAKQGPTKGKAPKKWSIVFRPLWKLDELQESTRRLNIANADNLYINNGTLLPEEVAETRFGGDTYDGSDMNLDMAVRRKMLANGPTEDPKEPTPVNPDDAKPQPVRQAVGQDAPSSNANPIGNVKAR